MKSHHFEFSEATINRSDITRPSTNSKYSRDFLQASTDVRQITGIFELLATVGNDILILRRKSY